MFSKSETTLSIESLVTLLSTYIVTLKREELHKTIDHKKSVGKEEGLILGKQLKGKRYSGIKQLSWIKSSGLVKLGFGKWVEIAWGPIYFFMQFSHYLQFFFFSNSSLIVEVLFDQIVSKNC